MSKKKRSALKEHQKTLLSNMLMKRNVLRQSLTAINEKIELMVAFGSPFENGELDIDSMTYVLVEEDDGEEN